VKGLRVRATGAGRQRAPATLDPPRAPRLEGFDLRERGLRLHAAPQLHR